jgi:hypothetical protein
VLSDGTREVELHHIAGNLHHDGLLMVYRPKEKLLTRLGLSVDQLLPLHGRIVPLAELHRAIGR